MITITEDFYKQVFQETRRMTTEEFVSRAKQLHPEYDYSKVNYINNKTKVIMTCPKHGDFFVIPNNFLNGAGCPKCGDISSANKRVWDTDYFILRAKQIHPEYDYSKTDYIRAKQKVIVTCPKHGDFLIKPVELLCGHGCLKCAKDHLSDIFFE